MSDKIETLQACLGDMADDLHRLALDWRITTVPFGDLLVGERVVSGQPFVTTVAQARHQLASMPRFDGGANRGESSADALLAAVRRSYRPSALTVLVLVTDEPAHLENGGPGPANVVTAALAAADLLCFVASPDLHYYRQWASATGGTWTQISALPDLSALRATFARLVCDVAAIASDVHRLAGGSAHAYRALEGRGPSSAARTVTR